jgi:ribosome-interacting GTPase 1
VYNKIDVLSIEEARACFCALLIATLATQMLSICAATQVDKIARRPYSVPISCVANLGTNVLLSRMWDAMDLRRMYTKKARTPVARLLPRQRHDVR